MVPPVAEIGKGVAVEVAAELPTNPTTEDVLVVEPDKVMTAVATTPSDIAVALSPQAKQVRLCVD